MFSLIKNAVGKVCDAINSKTLAIAAAGSTLFLGSQAHAEVTLAPTGVNVGEYVTASATALGAVIATVVGSYFAFLVIRKALSWARKAL